MKTTIFLVRHGEIDNPKKIIYGGNIDLKLSNEGRIQINHLAKEIKNLGYKIDKIYSSPLLKARESSDILSKVLNIKDIIIEEKLTDDNMPGLAGKSLKLLSQFSPTGMDQYSKEYIRLGNESEKSVFKRVKNAFSEILKKNTGKDIAIVSHGNPICFLLFHLLNPQKKILSIKILLKNNFLEKGSAIRLVLENGKVLDKEYIS